MWERESNSVNFIARAEGKKERLYFGEIEVAAADLSPLSPSLRGRRGRRFVSRQGVMGPSLGWPPIGLHSPATATTRRLFEKVTSI